MMRRTIGEFEAGGQATFRVFLKLFAISQTRSYALGADYRMSFLQERCALLRDMLWAISVMEPPADKIGQ
ncbi:hypothetical protein [Agrobacterium larrymoorei]|uniref:hypothetical protein n=1 Tax=Agrobacterium larrymoorei TaxID=160699 RepID=UPI0030C2C72A